MRSRATKASYLIPPALAVCILVVYGPAFLPGKTFSGMDFLNLLYPQSFVASQGFRVGVIPLWNWFTWSGCPLLAPMQCAVLYPPTWPISLLPLPYGLQLSILLHLWWAGLGSYSVARRVVGLTRIASVYAGVVFSCSGFLFGHLEQVNSVAAISWTPWIILAAFSVLAGGGSPVVFAAVTSLAVVSGHPQYMVLTLVLVFSAVILSELVLLLLKRNKALPNRSCFPPHRLALLLLAAVFAVFLSAAQVLPTLELSSLSERVWPYPEPMEPFLRFKEAFALVVPRYLNHLAGTEGRPLGFTEVGLYGGVLSLPLALAGLGQISRKRFASFLLIIGCAAFLYALGPNGLFAPVILKLVPYLAHSRGAARSLSVFMVVYAIAAAQGLDSCAALLSRRSSLCRLVPPAALLLLVADFSLCHRAELNHRIVDSSVITSKLPPSAITEIPRYCDVATVAAPNRTHRLMAQDSDLYLDDRAPAVLQRRLRLQPNLNTIASVAALDGYEEGLLPTRRYANFLRRYNRNLRNENPDSRLLAVMGSNILLSEYPPPPLKDWNRNGIPVYSPLGPLGVYHSSYSPAWFVDAELLSRSIGSPVSQFSGSLEDQRSSESTAVPFREETHGQRTPHPFDALTSAALIAATKAVPLKPTAIGPNSLTAEIEPYSGMQAPDEILFLQPPYPGWKIRLVSESSRADEAVPLAPISPIYSVFHWPRSSLSHDGKRGSVSVYFAPYSFRLGLFLSLLSICLTLASTALTAATKRASG